jgi:hypothetical protein
MRAEFTNGATVHEMYGDLGDGTLIGCFQYDFDARMLAEARLKDDVTHGTDKRWYIVVDHGSGKATVHRQPKTAEAAK